MGNLADRTDSRHSEDLQCHEMFYEICNAAPFPLAVVEGVELRYVYANSAYETFTGRVQSVLGRTHRDIFPEAEACETQLRNAIETAKGCLIKDFTGAGTGSERLFDAKAVPLAVDDSFTTKRLLLAAWNRTQIEHAPEKGDGGATLDAFFGASVANLGLYDEDLKFINCDPNTARYFGLKREEIIGRNRNALYPHTVLEVIGPIMDRVLETGEPVADVEFAAPIPTQSGELRYFRASYFPVPLPGGRRGIGAMGIDITDLKRAQEALRRSNQDLDRFAAVVSHDLQEPMRQITACAQLLGMEHSAEFKSDATVLLQFIEQGCRRMHSPVKDLLRLARPSGSVLPERVRLAELVRDCIAGLQVELAQAGGKISMGELPDLVAPPTLVAQIFQNLLSNAIKYRTDGRPLEIVVTAKPMSGEWIFCVSDNGRGISPEHREHIFQWLARAPAADVSGSGIGLATVKRAITQMGGRIWVESAVGQGSQFYFTIPVQTQSNE